jgi:Cys-tRNA(Pro)/Cys-tRNA(Cys) deacylase
MRAAQMQTGSPIGPSSNLDSHAGHANLWAMPFRNNVTRLLDSRKIKYELFEFSTEKHTAEETAALLGVPEDHVYKTLVVLREGKGKGGSKTRPLLVMVPAGRELNLKALAVSLGEKKLKMATQREAEELTGLQVGGISALALLNRGFEVCIERAALALPYIHVSAGQRGANIRTAVQDLIDLTGARLVETGINR